MTVENTEKIYAQVLKRVKDNFDKIELVYFSVEKKYEESGRMKTENRTLIATNRAAFSDESKENKIVERRLYHETLTPDSNYFKHAEIRVF